MVLAVFSVGNQMLVPIKSIKTNPNAGRTKYEIPDRPDYYLTLSKLVDDEDLYLISELGNVYCYSAKRVDLEKYKDSFIKLEKTQNIQTMYSISPEPKYIIEYEDLFESCMTCGELVNLKDLYIDYDQDYYNERCCPKCNCDSGLEVEFEKETRI